MAKSQTTINIKDAASYIGKEVTICDSVYSTRALDNLSLLNLGGKFPKELLTVIIFKQNRDKFEKEPVDLYNNKRICVTGKVQLYKNRPQILVNEPKQIETK